MTEFDKNRAKNKYEITPLCAMETAVVFAVLLTKLFYFNRHIRLDEFALVFALITVSMVAVPCFLICISGRNHKSFLMTIYSILCILMLIDSTYYSYISRLPSITALKMAYMLPDVSDTLLNLVTDISVPLVIDLPIWILYHVNIRDKVNKKTQFSISSNKLKNIVLVYLSSFVAVCAIAVSITSACGNLKLGYLKTELITYHISDVIDVMKPSKKIESVDLDKYIGNDNFPNERYYGTAENKNVITIQVEAMQNFVLGLVYNGQEVTPYLNSLMRADTVYFDNYYYIVGGGNTADAEFSANNSLYPPEAQAAYILYQDNDYYGLPHILKENGYSGAYAFHGYKGDYWNRENAYVKQGFDDFISREDLEINETTGLGITDYDFLMQTLEIIEEYEQPFYSFIITLSSHHPYALDEQYRMLTLEEKHEQTLLGDYLQAMRYVDYSIGCFIEGLKEKGLYENSIISIYGDHFGIPDYDRQSYDFMCEMLGREYYANDIFNIPLIIHLPESGISETISTTGSHVDYLPTILHFLGINNSKGIMFGQNLIAAEKGIVYQEMHMARGSFINDEIIYSIPMSRITIHTKVYDKITGNRLPADGYQDIIDTALDTYDDCMAILDANSAIP